MRTCMRNPTLAFLIALMCFTALTNVSAQTRTVGVSVGNTFKYTFSFDLNVTNTNFSLPAMLEGVFEQAKSIEWAQISILQVSGVEVTAQMVMHFKNGTEQSDVETTNVETGQGNLTLFLVGSDLNANDPVYVGRDSMRINETVTRVYPAGARQVNHQSISSEFNMSDYGLEGFNLTTFQQSNKEDVYWDKQLGVMVEMSYNMVTRSQAVNADITANIRLVESNVLTVPEFSSWAPLLLVLVIPLVAAIVFKFKKMTKRAG